MEGGYYSNLMDEGNNNLFLGDFNTLPEEQPTPVVESTPTLPEEQPAPVVENTPSSRPNQKRSKKFSEKDDKMLVSAWLNISTDPVSGTNQKGGTFWKRIFEYYHTNKDFTSERSQSSLLH